MAASSTTTRRCGWHHQDARLCPVPDPDLSDALADLQAEGALIVDIPPRLLDLCNVWISGCTEQADVIVIVTERRKREITLADGSIGDATFRATHQACASCLPDAVRADRRSDFLVEIHVPSHTVAVA